MLFGPQSLLSNIQSTTSNNLNNAYFSNGDLTPFDSIHLNVEPFIIYRQLSTFQRWLAIITIPTNHKDYQKVINLFYNLNSTIDSGVNVTYDITKDMSEYEKKNIISKHKWYTIDLRKEQDVNLKNKIDLKFANSSPDWLVNYYFDNIYSKVKGLIIFADDINQIPKSMCARSNFGLCDLTRYKLKEWLYNSTQKRLDNVIPDNINNKIVGYINAHNWIKLVTIL
jgi:hypothetical protein